MSNAAPSCAYGLQFGDKKSACHLTEEDAGLHELVEVGGLWFCQAHLPYSRDNLTTTYGDFISEEAFSDEKLKINWNNNRTNIFCNRIINYVKRQDTSINISGFVLCGTISFKEDLRKLNRLDASYIELHEGPFDFRSCIFNENTSFHAAKFFASNIIFDDTQFKGDFTSFDQSIFFHSAKFENAIFAHAIGFEGATFVGEATFSYAQFNGKVAHFDNCTFNSNAYFYDTLFHGNIVSFNGCNFNKKAWFLANKSNLNNAIDGIDIKSELYFVNTIFNGDVYFNNRRFNNVLSFERCRFNATPFFHGTQLHQDFLFPDISYFQGVIGIRAANAYRTLRLAMKQQEAHDEEAMFWVLEQRSKRNGLAKSKPSNWLPWVLSYGYEALSAYGLSVTRPIAYWFGLLFLFGWLIYPWLDGRAGCGCYSTCMKNLAFSFSQSARPFFIWGDNADGNVRRLIGPNADLLAVQVWATFDSILSLVLLTLFILALRRRFRMA